MKRILGQVGVLLLASGSALGQLNQDECDVFHSVAPEHSDNVIAVVALGQPASGYIERIGFLKTGTSTELINVTYPRDALSNLVIVPNESCFDIDESMHPRRVRLPVSADVVEVLLAELQHFDMREEVRKSTLPYKQQNGSRAYFKDPVNIAIVLRGSPSVTIWNVCSPVVSNNPALLSWYRRLMKAIEKAKVELNPKQNLN